MAKKEDIAYHHRRVWVDKGRYALLRENLYAESGKLLKTMDVREVMRVQGRWLAKSVCIKRPQRWRGNEFLVDSIVLDADIPDYLFSKAALKR